MLSFLLFSFSVFSYCYDPTVYFYNFLQKKLYEDCRIVIVLFFWTVKNEKHDAQVLPPLNSIVICTLSYAYHYCFSTRNFDAIASKGLRLKSRFLFFDQTMMVLLCIVLQDSFVSAPYVDFRLVFNLTLINNCQYYFNYKKRKLTKEKH